MNRLRLSIAVALFAIPLVGWAQNHPAARRTDQASSAPDRHRLHRGQVLPAALRAAPMSDYKRFRLREPPSGYSYYRQGGAAYLVSDQTGLIFEVVPLSR